jgi:hypothetical protein
MQTLTHTHTHIHVSFFLYSRRLTEAQHINRSLSALSNVIMKMNERQSRAQRGDERRERRRNAAAAAGNIGVGGGGDDSDSPFTSQSRNTSPSTSSPSSMSSSSSSSSSQTHIPFRDSKLTLLLRESLTGHTKVLYVL